MANECKIIEAEKAIEVIEGEVYKPQKSLIERIDDYESEIDRLRFENRELMEKMSDMYTQSAADSLLKEKDGQVRELAQALKGKDDEILILELKMDDLSGENRRIVGENDYLQSEIRNLAQEKEELIDGNDWLRYRLKELKLEVRKLETACKQTLNSKEALEQINKQLSEEAEGLKKRLRKHEVVTIADLIMKSAMPVYNFTIGKDEPEDENSRLRDKVNKLINAYREDHRKLDWTMMQIETHIQQVSSLVNHLREEVLL